MTRKAQAPAAINIVASQPITRQRGVMKSVMSVTGKVKEAAGYVKEEANEGKSLESQRKAQEGRDLLDEGRMKDGKPPKTTKPGAGGN